MMLLKVIHNYCNTDIVRLLLICPQEHAMCSIGQTPCCCVTLVLMYAALHILYTFLNQLLSNKNKVNRFSAVFPAAITLLC